MLSNFRRGVCEPADEGLIALSGSGHGMNSEAGQIRVRYQ